MNIELLRKKRKELGITQEDIAKKLNIARTNYTKRECGYCPFTLSDIREIRKILKLSNKETIEIFFS